MTTTTPIPEYSRCQICDANDWTFVREGSDLCRPEYKKVFKITRCNVCGHVMLNPKPDAAELAAAYSIGDVYVPYRPAWKQSGWPFWKILRAWTMSRRVSWLRQYGKGNELLDVGFGSGDFMVAAHRAGWSVHGVDYNSEMVDSVSRELGYDVRQGELEPGLWPEGYFDAVSIWNVLEHVPDPLHDLKLATQYLRPGGTVLIQVPSHRGAENGQWFGQYWRMLDIPRHLNFFNRRSISRLCTQAGLRLIAYKTPFVQSAWCYYIACLYWSKGNGNPVYSKFRFIALSAFVTVLLPYIAFKAFRARGEELVAIAIKC